MESSLKETKIAALLAVKDQTEWEHIPSSDLNVENTDPTQNSLRVWRNLPANTIEIKLKVEMVFPTISPAALFEMIGNDKERQSWDPRFATYEELEIDEAEHSTTYYAIGAKPSIPLISAREYVAKKWSLENGLGDGVHLVLMTSIDHEKYPEKTGYWDYVRASCFVQGTIIE